MPLECISAVTLATHDMERAVAFYEALGLRLVKGGAAADFTTFEAGRDALNLMVAQADWKCGSWGRVIFRVPDVDETYRAIVAAGIRPEFAPRDAAWGERYFHVRDLDGHEISFAAPL